jgi:hypothetical protein
MIIAKKPLVSIIIVNFNGGEVLLGCLESLEKSSPSIAHEVIVVDNCSTDGSPDLVEQRFPNLLLIRQLQNRGFGAGNNVGARFAKGEFLFLLNPDTILSEDILPHLIEIMQQDATVGIVGPKLLNTDGSLQISVSPALSIAGEYQARKQAKSYQGLRNKTLISQKFNDIQEVDIVVGAAFFIRKALFDSIGCFDENFFIYFEESDLCRRVQDNGWKIIYTPKVSLIHLKGYSYQQIPNTITVEYRRSQIYYYQKHRPIWEQIVLRMYLVIKFAFTFLKSPNFASLKVMTLALNFKCYPLKLTNNLNGGQCPPYNSIR